MLERAAGAMRAQWRLTTVSSSPTGMMGVELSSETDGRDGCDKSEGIRLYGVRQRRGVARGGGNEGEFGN